MQIQTDEIQPDIFRISTFEEGALLSFNHFLIRDSKSTLIHTGHQKSFKVISDQVARLINLSDLAYICFSHFEPDECGSLNEWLEVAPKASLCISKICDSSVKDVVEKPSKILRDGNYLDLGKHNLLFLETPHFPHNWEACLFYEVTTKTFFSSDLGSQRGFPQKTKNSVDLDDIIHMQSKYGYISYGPQFTYGLNKIRQLDIDKLATMHGTELNKAQTKELFDRLAEINDNAMKDVLGVGIRS